MEAVVHGNRGTARKVGFRSPYRFAGKTGTAQVVSIKQGKQYNAKKLAKKFHDHALFVAFAPLVKPRIAVAIIVENGGSGSGAAAPLAKKVMDFYLLPHSRLKLAESKQKKVKN
jgi:penicillin-binding protein 2